MQPLFAPGSAYSRRDIFKIVGVPEDTKGGDWHTGYTEHNGVFYLFVNVGVAGRTGHEYQNRWLHSGRLEWQGKAQARLKHPQIQAMIAEGARVLLFTREGDRDDFTFCGRVYARQCFDEEPVRVIWSLV